MLKKLLVKLPDLSECFGKLWFKTKLILNIKFGSIIH